MPPKINITFDEEIIYAYVTGSTSFHPIERNLDPTVYELFDTYIFHKPTETDIQQSAEYYQFHKFVNDLRKTGEGCQDNELRRLCRELLDFSPLEIKLT
jgi:hypothetical protein